MNKFNHKQKNHLLDLADLLENEEINLDDLYLESLLVDTLEEKAGNLEDVTPDSEYFVETDMSTLPVASFALTRKIMASVTKAALEQSPQYQQAPNYEPIKKVIEQEPSDLAIGIAQPKGAIAFASEKFEDRQNSEATPPTNSSSIAKEQSLFNLQNVLLALLAFVLTIFTINYINSNNSSKVNMLVANDDPYQQNKVEFANKSIVEANQLAQSNQTVNFDFHTKPLNEGLTYVSLRIATKNDNEKKLTSKQAVNLQILLINYELQRRLIGNKN